MSSSKGRPVTEQDMTDDEDDVVIDVRSSPDTPTPAATATTPHKPVHTRSTASWTVVDMFADETDTPKTTPSSTRVKVASTATATPKPAFRSIPTPLQRAAGSKISIKLLGSRASPASPHATSVNHAAATLIQSAMQTSSVKQPPRHKAPVDERLSVGPSGLQSTTEAQVIEIDDTDSEDADSDRESQQHDSSNIQQLLIYPPPPARGGIPINTEDYACLASEQDLNDVIIDFYCKYLHCEVLTASQQARTHIFSTFFYRRLLGRSAQDDEAAMDFETYAAAPRAPPVGDPTIASAAALERHERVKNWTKQVDLFDKDFVFVPVNENNHWYLAVICFPGLSGPVARIGGAKITPLATATAAGSRASLVPLLRPCILIMNSMDEQAAQSSSTAVVGGSGVEDYQHRRTVGFLQSYLTCEYRARFGERGARTFGKHSMPGCVVRVPQQDNFTDCGLFVLQFVEEFFLNPIKDFQHPIKSLAAWFDCMVVLRKREEIALLIQGLIRQFNPDRLSLLPDIEFPTKDGQLR